MSDNQTTNPGSSKNTLQNKCQKNHTSAYHFQITDIQRQWKDPEEARGRGYTYLSRKKGMQSTKYFLYFELTCMH